MAFTPSRSQQCAISHKDGPLLVLAGPGSGKTAVMTERIKCLIERYQIPPEQILALSFTKASAASLQQRFTHLTKARYPQVTIRTFHSLFYGILQYTYGKKLPKIISAGQQLRLVRHLLSEEEELSHFSAGVNSTRTECMAGDSAAYINRSAQKSSDKESGTHSGYIAEETVRGFLLNVSQIKNGIFLPQKGPDAQKELERLQLLYGRYNRQLADRNQMDMDDILVRTKRLLETNPDVLDFWQKQFPYQMIDEFQDISNLQFLCMVKLTGEQQNLVVVGDDDQSIYRFRGARPELMLSFKEYFPTAGQVLLETNYRCPAQVVDMAGNLISHNQKRFQKHILAAKSVRKKDKNSQQIDQYNLETHIFTDRETEISYTLETLQRHIADGNMPEEFAVLYRNNRQASAIAQLLTLHKVPYVMKESTVDIHSHWVVQDMLAYVRIACKKGQKNDFLRVINRPNRYFSREWTSRLRNNCSFSDFYSLYRPFTDGYRMLAMWEKQNQMLQNLPPFGALSYIRTVIGYDHYLKSTMKDEKTLSEHLDILNEFGLCLKEMKSWKEYDAFLKEREKKKAEKAEAQHGVWLSTIHGSKGLEFDHVCILDVNEGTIPYQRGGVIEDLEEERRLFYVAMTRAKNKLQLLSVRQEEKKLQPSRFLYEITEHANHFQNNQNTKLYLPETAVRQGDEPSMSVYSASTSSSYSQSSRN